MVGALENLRGQIKVLVAVFLWQGRAFQLQVLVFLLYTGLCACLYAGIVGASGTLKALSDSGSASVGSSNAAGLSKVLSRVAT